MSGNYDGEFSRRVAEARAAFAWNKERREKERDLCKVEEHKCIAEKARAIAGANALLPVTFMSAIEVVEDRQAWSLRLHYGTPEKPKWTNLVQLPSGHWALQGWAGWWKPSNGPLDEWCIKVLSGQIESEDDGVPF
jgi:hypothetical protein